MKKLDELFKIFDEKFKDLKKIDDEWYKDNCGVFSKLKKSSQTKNKSGLRTEEWYRARMVWSLVEYGYPKENIIVEFSIPKGSEGAKSLDPDIVIFKNSDWKIEYDKWNKSDSLPEKLAELMLVVMEAKDEPKKMQKAVTKQLAEAMKSYIGEVIYGVYFDNLSDILIFKKQGTNFIKRYYVDKIIDGEDVQKLNLSNRDWLTTLPTFKELIEKTDNKIKLDELDFEHEKVEKIDEDSFKDLLEVINRMQDRLNLTHVQDLVVEFITLKVADEKEVMRKRKKYFEFYIKPEEIQDEFGNNDFRERIDNLYNKARTEYRSIFTNREFYYHIDEEKNYTPSHADDEKFLIGMIKIFQLRTILNTKNANFNQIIFNNFGSNIEKAKEKQFFTPIPIVEMLVEMVNPRKGETLCDPCAGICDFLAMAFKYIYKDELKNLPTASDFYGFDKDNKILKLAELNLVLNGDGNANLKIMDSINTKLLEDGTISKNNFTSHFYKVNDWCHKNDHNNNIKQYNIILTNPPFGKGRDLKTGRDGAWDVSKNTLELYETWQVSGKQLSIDMGIIFLENAYKLLKEGGRMAIVLSNSIAGVATWAEIRKWFVQRMRIVALLDLPQDTFSETGVSTTVIIAYKPKKTEKNILNEDYSIFIREVKNIGYKVRTTERIVVMNPVFKVNQETFEREKDINNNDIILTDLPDVVADFKEWLESNKHKYSNIYNAFINE